MSDKFEKFKKIAAERESKAEASDGSTLGDEVKSRGNRNDNHGKIEEAKAKIKAAKEKAVCNSDGAVKARGVKKLEVGPKKRRKKTKKASKAFEIRASCVLRLDTVPPEGVGRSVGREGILAAIFAVTHFF